MIGWSVARPGKAKSPLTFSSRLAKIAQALSVRGTLRLVFSNTLNEIEPIATLPRLAWGLNEISECTGLSVAFLRAEVRAGRLPIRRFGRRVLVRDEDLKVCLSRGSDRESKLE